MTGALCANGKAAGSATQQDAEQGMLVAQAFGGNNTSGPIGVATALTAHGGPHGRLDFASETFVTHALTAEVVDTLTSNADAHSGFRNEQGLVPVAYQCQGSNVGEMGTLRAGNGNETGGVPFLPAPLPFDTTPITSRSNYSNPKPGDPCHPLAAGAHPPAIAFQERGRAGGRNLEYQEGFAYCLTAPSGGGRRQEMNILCDMAVRRLTPTECARLMGFPDDWARIPWRGKPASACPDGPQYKAYGNSIVTKVLRWIGQRIETVESTTGGSR